MKDNILSNDLSSKIYIAKHNNTVVGICYGSKEESQNILQALYVLPEYQQKGVGTKLWQHISSFFDHLNDTYVELVEYNKNAIKFYEKIGFKDTGDRFTEERFRMKSGSKMPLMRMVLERNTI